MGRRLLLEEPVFTRAFQEFDRGFEALSGWSVKSELLRDEATSRIGQSRFAMPAIFGVQIGLGALWQSYDVQPDFVLGHSFGELAAAYLAGAISLETATRMIHARCQIREKLGVDGAMLAVGLGAADVEAVLGPDTNIDIAAINGASAVTLAGTTAEIEQAARRITERYPSAQVRPVQSDTAWHSRQLASLEGWFRDEIGDVQWQTPSTPFVSTVTGRVEGRLDAEPQAARRGAAAHSLHRLLHLAKGADQRVLAAQARLGQFQGIAALPDQGQPEIGLQGADLLSHGGRSDMQLFGRAPNRAEACRRLERAQRGQGRHAGLRRCGHRVSVP